MGFLLAEAEAADGGLVIEGVLLIALLAVGALIVLVGLVSCVVSIWLAISYTKYNRRANSAGLTGEETARKVLDANGLQHIKVKATGSLLFGNSYSHFFKKVRIRRLTRHKTSLTALAIGSQKAALAVLDKEGDPDMKKRIKCVPLITFGPFAFIPLILVGALVDVYLFHAEGYITLVAAGVSILFYALSLVLSILTLKTEKKAQERACRILTEEHMATEEEIADLQKLYRVYNVQYINDIVLSMLELVYYILRFALIIASNSNASSNSR